MTQFLFLYYSDLTLINWINFIRANFLLFFNVVVRFLDFLAYKVCKLHIDVNVDGCRINLASTALPRHNKKYCYYAVSWMACKKELTFYWLEDILKKFSFWYSLMMKCVCVCIYMNLLLRFQLTANGFRLFSPSSSFHHWTR